MHWLAFLVSQCGKETMKTWTCKTFKGHWPVGSAAVVYAETQDAAAELLNDVLKEHGLSGDAKPEDMQAFPSDGRCQEVRVLCDGNY